MKIQASDHSTLKTVLGAFFKTLLLQVLSNIVRYITVPERKGPTRDKVSVKRCKLRTSTGTLHTVQRRLDHHFLTNLLRLIAGDRATSTIGIWMSCSTMFMHHRKERWANMARNRENCYELIVDA
jgi:hypothetical protein